MLLAVVVRVEAGYWWVVKAGWLMACKHEVLQAVAQDMV